MGSRSAEALDEIEAIRARLDSRLDELQRRMPPALQLAKAAIGVAGAGGTLWAVKTLIGRGRSKKAAKHATSVTVRLMPGGAVPVAIGIAAVWAVVKIREMRLSASETSRAMVPVRPLQRRTP